MKKLLVVLLCLGLAGCATVQVEPTNKNYDFNASKRKVFDAALLAAQELNLDVEVLEKDSGFIRFNTVILSPAQLDQYCQFPLVFSSSGKPVMTFQQWSNNLSGPASGKLSITILVTEHGATSSVNVRSNLNAFNRNQDLPCNSKGVFEDEFISKLQSHLK